MARTDLLYDVRSGDIALSSSYPDNDKIVDLIYEDGYLVGMPDNFFNGATVYARIPFVESGKELKVRVSATIKPDTPIIRPLGLNFTPGELVPSDIYNVVMEGTNTALRMCNLPFISLDIFKLKLDRKKKIVILGDGKTYDLVIGPAKNQNTALLTICDKGGNYRYPNTGVGVHRYINTHRSNSELSNEIIRQFSNDAVSVISATFDKDSGLLNIETKE